MNNRRAELTAKLDEKGRFSAYQIYSQASAKRGYVAWQDVMECIEAYLEKRAEAAPLSADAKIVRDMLELGDQRLLASDGPAGGQLPDLSPEEWGKVYRACKRIARLDGPHGGKDG